MGLQAKENTREPIILSFDSPETRDKVLQAAAKKGLRGSGSFPVSSQGKEKLYFSEPRQRQRSSGKKKTPPPEDSDPEIAVTRKKILLDERLRRQNGNSDRGLTNQNEAGLDNLIKQVTNIVPRSRIDAPSERICVGTVPVDTPHDCRGRINELRGIKEVCLGDVQMGSHESNQESQDDALSAGSNSN